MVGYNPVMEIEARRGWTFYYDGDCGICQQPDRQLARADVLGRVWWVDFRRLEAPPEGLGWADLETAAWLRGPWDAGSPRSPSLHSGFCAFSQLSVRLPLLLPLAPLLWFPGVGVPGGAVYKWVVLNRQRLSLRCGLPS